MFENVYAPAGHEYIPFFDTVSGSRPAFRLPGEFDKYQGNELMDEQLGALLDVILKYKNEDGYAFSIQRWMIHGVTKYVLFVSSVEDLRKTSRSQITASLMYYDVYARIWRGPLFFDRNPSTDLPYMIRPIKHGYAKRKSIFNHDIKSIKNILSAGQS